MRDDTAESMGVPLADKLSWGKVEESRKGRMADALAHPGEDGRDKLRKAAVRCK